jgi:hypothetical protein
MLKERSKGRKDEEEDVSQYWMASRKLRIPEFKENSVREGLWTCLKTEYGMNEWMDG